MKIVGLGWQCIKNVLDGWFGSYLFDLRFIKYIVDIGNFVMITRYVLTDLIYVI